MSEKAVGINQSTTISLAVVGSIGAFISYEAYTRGSMEEKIAGMDRRLIRIEAKLDSIKPSIATSLMSAKYCVGYSGNDNASQHWTSHNVHPFR